MRTNTGRATTTSSSMEEKMEKKERQAEDEDELLQAAHAQMWTQVFSFTHSQTLRRAVELHIPDIIHALQPSPTLPPASHSHPPPTA
ncbi:hypothetical protein AAC387_Pa09g0241 [Persea americana]